MRKGEGLPPRPAQPAAPVSGDEFDLLSQELNRSHEAAVAAVVQASRLSSSVGNEQKVEVFVNLARRLQSLVHREIQLLDELENEVEDPELLKGLFHIDHLATRIRRHAENLAVLGGAISRRQWSNPVTMTEVLRSSIAEVEQYPRVKLVPRSTVRSGAMPWPTSSTSSPNSSRTRRCSPRPTRRCCCAPSTSPRASRSRSRTGAWACPSPSRTR
ncbi:hypothetical protein O1L60_32940 [Streptomyces diastatochromogenes]|nr:hypothetical protein [Streptomyces diastatochromogenes]